MTSVHHDVEAMQAAIEEQKKTLETLQKEIVRMYRHFTRVHSVAHPIRISDLVCNLKIKVVEASPLFSYLKLPMDLLRENDIYSLPFQVEYILCSYMFVKLY